LVERTINPLKCVARRLRREQTDAKKLLWSKLRNSQTGYKFRRQYPIDSYIADFVCLEKKLVIEVDGGQHTPETDKNRSDHIERLGYKIIRFWNDDVLKNIEGVTATILKTLEE
jgi:very-short-patch-repair endonuclease